MYGRTLALAVVLALASGARAQNEQVWRDSCAAFWSRTEAEFRDPRMSPLKAEDRATFTGLQRFPYDPKFHVMASFSPAEAPRPFKMRTTTDRTPEYQAYGTLRFTLDGKEYKLTVYQNLDLIKRPGLEHYLFLPFTDLTNGEETYGGGRFLDLEGPLGPQVELDLNKAYNPYCAYDHRFSCPIPPPENHLALQVRAGVLKFHE